MKAMIVTASAVAALAALATAMPAAAAGWEASLGYSAVDAGDASLGAITGRLGWKHGYFGVEGEFSGGVQDDNVGAANVELRHQFAGYGVVNVPMNENFDLFARLGYGQTKFAATAGATGLTGTENSVNYGAGAQYFFDGKNGVRGDYTRMDFDNSGADADVWSLSYVRRF